MPKKKTSQIFSHRYELLRHLGEGGIGKVYRAYDRWTKKEVALKVLTADFESPHFLESFKKEFLLLTQLKHPGVVEVLDFGYSEEAIPSGQLSPYFTMELVKGKNLGGIFANFFDPYRAAYEFERLARLIWQICDVLEFLHLREIVHCDLKPDNLKVTDRAFRPKILDFGLYEKMSSKKSRDTKGTLPYMAPEMFLEEPLDERTDLYSLGVILYELVTSQLPFSSDDPVKIVSAHLQQKPTPPSQLNHNLPSSLDELIVKMLKKSPADRPENAIQVKEMIEAQLKPGKTKAKRSYLAQEKTFLAHLHSGPMVGREAELSQLEHNLNQAISSQGSSLFLSGEQGVGKVFLLKHLKVKCQLQGIIFADSTCLEKQTLAYQPLFEILHKLEPYVENRCPDQIVQNLKGVFKWSGDNSSTSLEDQSYFHQRIADLLLEISQFFPFAMVLENLQWVDLPTLKFFELFQKQKQKGKVFLCCSLREEKLKENAPFQALVEHCIKKGYSPHLKLNRFDLSRTKSLILSRLTRQKFQPELFNYVHQRTSGNPFFIIEVLKYLVEQGIIFLSDSIWAADMERLEDSAIPDSIETVLLKNLERYDKKTFDFLKVIAVIGKKFTLRLLRELNLFDEKTLSETLSLLTQDQVLIKKEESAGGKTDYEFANQSLQNLLYQRLDEAKRISLHKEVGVLLENISSREEESVFDIAFHYLEGKEFDKAYQYALLSAEKMKQRFANDEVLRYLANAVEAASKISNKKEASEKRVAALMKRADFCKRVGGLNQAERDYQTILKLIESSFDLKMLAETYNGLGDTYRLQHDYKKGITCLKKALEFRQKSNNRLEVAHTLNNMGLLYRIDSQYKEAIVCLKRAINIYESLQDKFYVASTLNNIGLIYWSQHLYKRAMIFFKNSLRIKKELGNKEEIARALNNIGATFFELGEYGRCIDHFLESFRLNEELKNQKEMAFNLENLSEAYRKIGNYPAALEYGPKGLKLAKELDFTERVGCILKDLGVIHFELGEYQKTYRYFQEAKEVAEKVEDKELQILVLIALSKFCVVINDEKSSLRLLEEASTIINSIGDEKPLIAIYQIKSWLKKKEGKFQEALKHLDKALALAKKLKAGEELFSLDVEYGELYLEQKEWVRSKECLDRARNFGLSRYVLFQPPFYLISGRLEWTCGNLKSAQKNLETALRLAEKLNNPEMMWQIHHHLGKLFLSSHNIERAYHELENAGRILKKLSERIKDEEMKQNYLKDLRKKELLSDLREVAKELVGDTKIA